jgi:hypothetical protein
MGRSRPNLGEAVGVAFIELANQLQVGEGVASSKLGGQPGTEHLEQPGAILGPLLAGLLFLDK